MQRNPPVAPAGTAADTGRTRPLRGCEEKLLDWLRTQARPFGRVTATVTVDYQDGVPVMIRVVSPVEVEERFR